MRNRDNKKPFKKTVGAPKQYDTDKKPPIFSFEKMIDNNGFSVNCCTEQDQAALARQIFLFSRMSWREIKSAPRHGLGSEKIERSSLKVPLPANVTDDVTLLALRFSAIKPMIGYRVNRVFYVLLLDHNFEAYEH